MNAFSILTPPKIKGVKIPQTLSQLSGAAQAVALANIGINHGGMTLVVTHDTPTALQLEGEISYLLKDKAIRVLLFPDREILPYDSFSPHQDLVSQRLETLVSLSNVRPSVLIVPISTLMVRLPPQSFLAGRVLIVNKEDVYPLQQIKQGLINTGYHFVEQVYEHGEFAVRGSIIDIFPMGADQPYRIELFDDEVESIRHFDPETQRSSNTIDSIRILPAKEFPTDSQAIEGFRQRYRRQFGVVVKEPESVYQMVSRNIMPAGIESYLPLFFETTATLFDYLPDKVQMITIGDIETATKTHLKEVSLRYENRRVDPLRPLLEPQKLYLLFEQLFAAFKQLPRIRFEDVIGEKSTAVAKVQALPDVAANYKLKQPLDALKAYVQPSPSILFSVESEGRREVLLELLDKIDIKPTLLDHFDQFIAQPCKFAIIVSPLSQGASIEDDKGNMLAIICETELFGQRIAQRRRRDKQRQISQDAVIKDLAELKIGQAIVHIDHGIGVYQGLETIDTGGLVTEYLKLEYLGGDKLYVPVASLHLISRYSVGSDKTAPVSKLGNETWSKAKRKAIEKIRDVAAELLDVYARRQVKSGDACQLDEQEYAQFAGSFPFEETLDQETSIAAVLKDMCSPIAMDRLVCGDVGFGKTEVAMRAAFAAVNDNKQVAILVPTTLLAQQHFENFNDRFAPWPIRVEVVSRFKTAKEQQAIFDQLEQGKIDIIIGTHKLLQSTVKFENLGLLIIDEEHRFGVRQKEKIKALRANIDILTLTATPIPRTLNMAMSGIRDLSIIATPPAKRLAVKTFVREYDQATIHEALQREILRGGQVYYLHNCVETIDKRARDIESWLPEARVITAHGQMRERELEKVMFDFYHQKYNVLVCTTIIETGIDIPSANTIAIERADKFGLAQLHQLRGRVGRSHHQAYAYLMTPHPKLMTKDARKRLEAISALEDLGAGFMLATQDLEIRGAGELLGDEQSGHISKIGFTLYMEMLEDAVKLLRQGKEPSLDKVLKGKCEIDLRIPALLPETYVHDVNIRLSLYKRIANCTNETAVDDLKVELIDRFGLLPQPSKNLFELALHKHHATTLGIAKIEIHAKGGSIEFNDDNQLDPKFIIGLLQNQPQIYRMDGPSKLKFTTDAKTDADRLALLASLMAQFSRHCYGEPRD